MNRYVCPYCYGRGGYYKPIYDDDNNIINKEWQGCPYCRNGIIKE